MRIFIISQKSLNSAIKCAPVPYCKIHEAAVRRKLDIMYLSGENG